MTSAPTQVSDDDAKAAYLKRCMDMTHGQLYAELMRVHREATLLLQAAVEQNNREWIGLTDEEITKFSADWQFQTKYEKREQVIKAIEASLKEKNHGNNT